MRIGPLFLTIILAFSACNSPHNGSTFEKKHLQWQNDRIESLKSETGWLNLAGLYWLEKGENTVGSDSSNTIIFPGKAPAHIGTYFLKEGKIRFRPDSGSEMEIATDKTGNATVLETGSMAWFIIERNGKYGIRLRDYEHPAIMAFHGIESFPPNIKWRIEADYEMFDEPREIMIPTVLGIDEKNSCPGIIRFRIGDTEQVLYPTSSETGFFIVFADETSGNETYGGGRFIYTGKPGKDGKLIIDFNRAYNPPCAFTPFATCPFPPRENILTIRIEAGEKFAGH